MSTTDSPGVNDLDSSCESSNPNEADGPSVFPTTAARRGTIGNPIQINPKIPGCGCLGCSSVIALSLISMIVGTVTSIIIPEWKAINRYVQGSCVVLDKKLDSRQFDQVVNGQPGVQKNESDRPRIYIR